ncbi:hypothetical protein [Bradyrhizobium sp.]|uniref:hypothetical protein n=1 Tax=Bradyrhizobium sp. TaxID=376 RepID=UPI0027350F58|nr:hypothetical protein [Bradyrhizobium sp.]MDP3078680.1 hypothetical protein [Bradyrhizobium sp.]
MMMADEVNENAEELLEEEPEAGAEVEETEEEAEGQEEETEGETEGEEGEGEEEAEVDPKDAQIAELKTRLATTEGRVGTEVGTRKMLSKVIKQLEEKEGVVDRDALAEAVGIDRSRLDGYLDAPDTDDQGEFQRRAGTADKQLKSVAKVLKANGKDADQISASYVALLNHDPEERHRFMETPEDELGAYVIDRVTEAGDKVKDLVEAKGDIFAVLTNKDTRIAELEAENKALREGTEVKKPIVKKTRVPIQSGSAKPAASISAAAEGSAIRTVLG